MPFPYFVQSTIKAYDNTRSLYQRLFGDSEQIACVKNLSECDRNNFFKISSCFVNNLPDRGTISYMFFHRLLFGIYNQLSGSYTITEVLENALVILKENNIFNEENFQVVMSSVLPQELATILGDLNKKGLLYGIYKNQIILSANPFFLSEIILLLDRNKILNQININDINSSQVEEIYKGLDILEKDNLISKDITDIVIKIRDPYSFAEILILLNDANILNEDNIEVVINTQNNIEGLSYAFKTMNSVNLLDQNHIDNITKYPVIYDSPQLWLQIINNNLFNQNVFENLIRIATRDQAALRLNLYIENFINQRVQPEDVNPMQSTHNTSVHQTVSESSLKLKERYKSLIDNRGLQYFLSKVKKYINQLPNNTVKNSAAQRFLENITDVIYSSVDDASKISVRELVILAYIAVNDEQVIIGTIDDARIQFIEALYEIQRGYNIDINGFDTGGIDDPICIGGMFNKLIEKLQGIHPDCEIRYITPQTATLKFRVVVIEEANRYLKDISNSKTGLPAEELNDLISQIKTEGFSVIWNHIKDNVSDMIFEEFGSLYKNRLDSDFIGLIDSGEYTNIDDLDVANLSICREGES